MPLIVVVACGGFGKLVAAVLNAYARLFGYYFHTLCLDNDHRLPDPFLLPDGTVCRLPESSLLRVGADHPRNELTRFRVLAEKYVEGGLLRGIPVFETYPLAGAGGGGYAVISAIDIELFVTEIRRAVAALLLRVVQLPRMEKKVGFWERPPGAEPSAATDVVPRPRVIVIGGGCGSFGPASHLLLPYLIRDVARKMRLPDRRVGAPEPRLVGVIGGPDIYAGLHPRTGATYVATLHQLEQLTQTGLSWAFIDGEINDAAPPYSRIVLADGLPNGDVATELEIQQFAAQVAKGLFTALFSDVFDKLDSLRGNDRATPWMTLQSVLAYVDWKAVEPLATTIRSSARLASLAGRTKQPSS